MTGAGAGELPDGLGDGFDPGLAPLVRTEVPGPRSTELWARDAAFHASNSSPGAQWLRLVLKDGRGAVVRDVDDNLFVDFSSGAVVANLGHAPAPVARALAEESRRLLHYFDFATPARVAFFEALARTLPPALQTFQMYSTGAEAVEAALRLAKSHTGGYEVISFHQAWHGRTLGAMSLMGGFPLKQGYGPFAPGAIHSPNANCYRCPLGLERDRCEVACATLVDRVYEQSSEGRLAAVIVEPVQGVGGVIAFPPEFLAHLRELCDRTGALLIFDEILTGVGRTGPMWAFETSGVVPDVLLAGKGLAGGYPISLIASRREVLDGLPFGRPGAGASTFASGNMACAAGAATLGMLEDGSVLANGRAVGASMLAALRDVADRHPIVGDVRGAGMLLALELVGDRAAKTPVAPAVVRRLVLALARRGVLVAGAGSVLRLTPPLVITEDMALAGVALLDDALGEIDASPGVTEVFEGLHHVGVTVADMDRAVAFWEGLLGVPARDRTVLQGPRLGTLTGYPDVRIESCWVDLPGGVALELLRYLDRDDLPYDPGTAHPGNVHVCLRVADMGAAHAHAVGCGARAVGGGPIVVAAGPRAGARLAYLRDPDGVTIELVQEPPG